MREGSFGQWGGWSQGCMRKGPGEKRDPHFLCSKVSCFSFPSLPDECLSFLLSCLVSAQIPFQAVPIYSLRSCCAPSPSLPPLPDHLSCQFAPLSLPSLTSPTSCLPAFSQVSAAVAAEVQDARRRPPAGLPLQASLPCGPLSPPWPFRRAMVPSLASQGPRNTHRYPLIPPV